MRRSLLPLALLLGVLPANASAAPFGEVAFRPAGGTATCLRATGLPGEVVRSTATGAQFLQAGPGGLTPVADVRRDALTTNCPQAAARPNGMGVVAFALYAVSQSEMDLQVALREPGGAWGAPAVIATSPQIASGHPLAVDVSERGDALVAFATGGNGNRLSFHAVRRAPGAPFGADETLLTAPATADSEERVAAGMTASGEAIVAFWFQPAPGEPREVWAATAPPGAPFGPAAKLGTLRTGSPFSLAVGAGGHALVAFPSGDDLLVAERAPGAGFGPATRVGAAVDRIVVHPAAAVRADGGAVVAWANALSGDVQAVVRAQPGAFGAPLTLAPKSGLHYPRALLETATAFFGDDGGELLTSAASPDEDGGNPRATITPDGRAFVTWAGAAQRDGVWWSPPRTALVPLTGGAASQQTFGAELREAGSVTSLITADSTAAVAWADNGSQDKDGRLHLALEGVPDGADPAAPQVTLTPPKRRVLKADEDLLLTVRCSAACDVRAQIGTGLLAASDTVSLARAGTGRLRLSSGYRPLAGLRASAVGVQLRYGAPGARRASVKTVSFRLRRLPDAPRPKVLGAVARRSGSAVVVTWRSDRDAKPSNFVVYGSKTRAGALDLIGDGDVKGSGRRFRVRLRDAREARYVRVIARADGARKYETTIVRVRG